jgi:hypothetical protein
MYILVYVLVQSHASSDRKKQQLVRHAHAVYWLFAGWRKAFEGGSLLWHCHWLPTEHQLAARPIFKAPACHALVKPPSSM